MIFHIVNEEDKILFSNAQKECYDCIEKNAISICRTLFCPYSGEEKRIGFSCRKNMKLILCSDRRHTKTSKLFKEKIELLSYTVPSMLLFKNEIAQAARDEEREKYAKLVHNLKTLNAQSIMSQYKFIPQDLFAESYENLFATVQHEVERRPKEATIALLKQSKNNEYMKTEFSTHEKLTMDSPSLIMRNHVVKKVILNVYHSFDLEFKDKGVYLKIDDVAYNAWFDYDTIRVAFFHLFSNASKYIAKDSTLHVGISAEEDNVIVKFIMKSLYIYEDEINTIFDDHQSGKAAKDLNLNGSGLGMGLIRKALTINGGKIEVIPGREKIKKSGIDYGDNLFKITIPKDKK